MVPAPPQVVGCQVTAGDLMLCHHKGGYAWKISIVPATLRNSAQQAPSDQVPVFAPVTQFVWEIRTLRVFEYTLGPKPSIVHCAQSSGREQGLLRETKGDLLLTLGLRLKGGGIDPFRILYL